MADKTKIEWADASWNPTTGCNKVSSGCKHCYAQREWLRLSANPQTRYFGRRFTEVACHPDVLSAPLRWRRSRRIFVNSMSDLFHEDIPDAFVDQVFAVMLLSARHQFQVLTKRPDRMAGYFARGALYEGILRAADSWRDRFPHLPNVGISDPRERLPSWIWLGVSVENQATAEARIPLLLQTPATVRWISAEPLLGPLRLNSSTPDWLRGLGSLDWVVAGGETGPNARPMHPDWVRSLRDQCRASGTAFFFKQWGEWAPICALDEKTQDRFYRSNRRAREWEDQKIVDDYCGHTCTVKNGILGFDGVLRDMLEYKAFRVEHPIMAFRTGRNTAGRLLDGRAWAQYPN
jgi:protein gp37